MEKTKTLYLIDGTAFIYRAYHAIRSLTNSNGLPTNAAFGFTRILIKLIEDRSPEYVVMFFDAKGPTFRHKIYKEYKANRPPMPEDLSVQIPHIKKITKGFNIHIMEMQGFEADDLIGTFRLRAEQAGFSVVMVTGDKDFVQLVTDNAIIWDPMKEKTIDIKTVRKSFGVEPNQMVDVMGLSGDSSDNIPGVPGIGPKTALTLIKTFGSMDRLYEQLDKITKQKQHQNLVQYKAQAFLSRELVKINTNVPVAFNPQDLKLKEPDHTRLSSLFKMLEFRQLQKDFPKQADLSKKQYVTVLDTESLSDLVTRLKTSNIFAVDTETTSKDPMKAELVG
ncbi:MAG: 5'-3' exonuclease H3TH domain-containing protein, partial [Thermodesulfobacteriota bacterium]|nr:5'-3' exonuclease H3TH domain-containing protein [Thermodesulfobacteriota bacterium]